MSLNKKKNYKLIIIILDKTSYGRPRQIYADAGWATSAVVASGVVGAPI